MNKLCVIQGCTNAVWFGWVSNCSSLGTWNRTEQQEMSEHCWRVFSYVRWLLINEESELLNTILRIKNRMNFLLPVDEVGRPKVLKAELNGGAQKIV